MIKCEQLEKQYDKVHAVKGVSFTIKDGTFVGLLGPNGAGKTTLLHMIIGLLDNTRGTISFDDVLMCRDAMNIKKQLGVVSQHINLDKELTVWQNMLFAGKLYRMPKEAILNRSNYLLELLGLDNVKGRMTKKLSGGMKRKLMLAKALIHNPQYIFLDEPTVGIDVKARKDIWYFLKQLHKEGKTIVLTTHYIEEAEALCDTVMLMNDGLIVKEDTPENYIKALGQFKVTLNKGDAYADTFYTTLQEAKESVKKVNYPYTIAHTNLEDVFYYYTNKRVNEWK